MASDNRVSLWICQVGLAMLVVETGADTMNALESVLGGTKAGDLPGVSFCSQAAATWKD